MASFKFQFKFYLLRQTLLCLIPLVILCHSTLSVTGFLAFALLRDIYLLTCSLSSPITRKVHQEGQGSLYFLGIQDLEQCQVDSRYMQYIFVA